MFWGLIMEPNKRYTQVVEKPFHISQAAMDISTGDNDPCQLMVMVDGKNFLVCTLQKNKCIQVPLDLYFKAGDSISFLTNGKCNVHLTGYLDPEFEEEEPSEDEEEEEEEDEVPVLVPAKSKRKLENSNDVSANKKIKQEKKQDKKSPVAADSSSDEDDEDNEDQLQKLLNDDDIDTDENDDSFKVNTSAEADDSDEEDSDEEAEEEEEEEKDSSDEAETTLDTSKEEKVDMSKLTKSQRRNLKRKLAQQAKQQPQVNGIDKPKDTKQDGKQQTAEKKKPDAKKEVEKAGDKKEKKSLSGGVFIEDTKVGNGPVAKPGKTVMVYYEGRLKQNNKMFDSCLKGPGFKFRLGAKEVISGWDVGIAGMKVGGKRKVVCPPAMAYGAKGSPPVIPPNSTLVFEVELKNVK